MQKGVTPCSTSKANPPHSGLDRLCYKNGPFVSSGLLPVLDFEGLRQLRCSIMLNRRQHDIALDPEMADRKLRETPRDGFVNLPVAA